MKASSRVEDLSAKLKAAAAAPLVSSGQGSAQPTGSPSVTQAPASTGSPQVATGRRNAGTPTQQITLRPRIDLWARYINAAAERSKQAGRTVTPQEIALEVMEKAAL